MAKEQEKRIARLLYVEQGKTAKEVAELVSVSEATLSKWVISDGWKKEREARASQPKMRANNIQQLIGDEAERRLGLQRELDYLANTKTDDDKEATATKNNQLSEIRKQIASIDNSVSKWNKILLGMSKDKVSLAVYIEIMEEIFEALSQYDSKLFVKLVPFQEYHLNKIADKYR